MSYRLAASSEMIYLDRPFLERVERIRDRGLLVEIWDWSNKDIDALANSGAEIVSMTGTVSEARCHLHNREAGFCPLFFVRASKIHARHTHACAGPALHSRRLRH